MASKRCAPGPTMPVRARPVRGALTALSLCMLLPSLSISIATVALPTVSGAFSVSFQAVQWIVLAYLLAVTTLIVSVGRLGDTMGRKRLLLTGLLVFTGASVLCGLAPVFGLLIVARALQGVGAAILMALTLAFVGDAVPKARMGRAMGLLGAMSAIGTALGPSAGGALVAAIGWRSVFLVNLPLGVLALWLAWRFLPRDPARAEGAAVRFDPLGTVLLVAVLGAYALAMTTGQGQFGPWNAGLLIGALGGGVLFVRVELTTASPLIRMTMFGDPVLTTGVIMSALVTTVVMATLVVGPFYLSAGLGLDTARVGLVMSAGPVVTALMSTQAGRLVDRLGAGTVTLVGLGIMGIGVVGLPMLPARLGTLGYIVPLVVTTAGYALFQTANNTAVMQDVPGDRRGVVSGLLSLSRNLGFITGTAVMGAVFAMASGTTALAMAVPDIVRHGMKVTFFVATGLVLVALLTALGGRLWAARGRAVM